MRGDIIQLFLPLVFSLLFYPVGTVQEYDDIFYHYSIELNQAEKADEYLITYWIGENFDDSLDLSVGKFNFDAFDNNGNLLSFVDCNPPFIGVIPKGERAGGYLCWERTGDAPYWIKYHHSAFSPNTFGWKVP